STRPRASPSVTCSMSSGVSPSVTRAKASATERRAIRSPSAPEGPRTAAGLLDQPNAGELNSAVNGLYHVVDGEAGDRDRGQRFHLDTGLRLDLCRSLDADAGGITGRREIDGDLRQGQKMAQRDQLMRPLCGNYAGDTRRDEHIALRRFPVQDQVQ